MRPPTLILLIALCCPVPALAQSISLRVTGETTDKSLTYAGSVRFNLFTRIGRVKGTTNSRTKCEGRSKVNFVLTKGQGMLRCEDGLWATFSFNVITRAPLRAKGTAQLSDGRTATLRIFK